MLNTVTRLRACGVNKGLRDEKITLTPELVQRCTETTTEKHASASESHISLISQNSAPPVDRHVEQDLARCQGRPRHRSHGRLPILSSCPSHVIHQGTPSLTRDPFFIDAMRSITCDGLTSRFIHSWPEQVIDPLMCTPLLPQGHTI